MDVYRCAPGAALWELGSPSLGRFVVGLDVGLVGLFLAVVGGGV